MIDRALELSRRGFFGAASAALVAAVAPRRAYSFLMANPLALPLRIECELMIGGRRVPMVFTYTSAELERMSRKLNLREVFAAM